VLVVLDVEGDASAACLMDVILSDAAGESIEQMVENCTTIVEVDDCSSGEYDCAGVCDGDAVEDCAGECGGDAMDACNFNADATEDDGSCDFGTMCWDDSHWHHMHNCHPST
jgi:hypothetical protein